MAYRDLDDMFAAPVSSRPAQPGSVVPRGFSSLEWSVIAVARRDRLGSLSEPGRVSRALGSLFGIGATSRLADPQLEALRRLAVHAWRRGYAVPQSEIDSFVGAGFTLAQAETLVASVTGDRMA